MNLSIVIPTLGRVKELESLLNSILIADYDDLEVIIVDQNFSDLLDNLISHYSSFMNLRSFKVNFRGLSKAKNFGISKAKGEIICFIDDDAEFCIGTIQNALSRLCADADVDVVCGRCVDRLGNDSVVKFKNEESWLTKRAFEGKFIESTMFFKSRCFDSMLYDEKLGIGAFHGAEEGYDLVYRMLEKERKILFDPSIVFYHPQTIFSHDTSKEIQRVFSYRCGFAYVCTKHKLSKRYYKRLFSVTLYIFYAYLFKRRVVRYYIAELLGLFCGKVIK